MQNPKLVKPHRLYSTCRTRVLLLPVIIYLSLCPRAYPSPRCNSRLSCRDNLRSCQHWQGRPRNNLYGRNVIISMRRYPAELSQPRTEPTLKLLPGSNVKTLFVLQLNCSITRDDAEVEGTVVGRSYWSIGSKLYSCVWRVK